MTEEERTLTRLEQLGRSMTHRQAPASGWGSLWSEAFEASHRTVEHINKAMTLAQEVFDGQVVLVSGALSEDVICDEFQCLRWKEARQGGL